MTMHPLELIHPRSLKYLADSLQSLIVGRLWLKVLIGLVLGVLLGSLLGPSVGWVAPKTARLWGSWLALPGHVFLGSIQMIVIPLVFASIVRGLASSDNMEQLKSMGLRAVGFFVLTTTVAIVIGIGIALLIEPGQFLDKNLVEGTASVVATDPPPSAFAESIPDTIVDLIPKNPIGAMANSEMLSVVLFAFVMGVALVSLSPEHSAPLLTLLGSLQQVCMTVVGWAMKLAPFAVFGLMAQMSAQFGLETLAGMGIYVATVLLGLAILLLLYLLIVWVVSRQSPLRFLAAVREVQLLAFSTSSSAAVMPLSMKTAEDKLHVRPTVSQFIIPLGATINMNGTALYQGVATVFLAQVYGLDLNAGQLALVVVTAVGASIGSPATPGVGIVILSMVLGSVGIPLSGLGLILGVDRILDMARTAVNVTGDLVASVVMNRYATTHRDAAAQLADEAAREDLRKTSHQDVVVSATSPSS